MLKYLLMIVFAGTYSSFSAEKPTTINHIPLTIIKDVLVPNIEIACNVRLFMTCKKFANNLNRDPETWEKFLHRIFRGPLHPKLCIPNEHPKDTFIRALSPQSWELSDLDDACYGSLSISSNGLWVLRVIYGANHNQSIHVWNLKTGIDTKFISDDSISVEAAITDKGEVFGSRGNREIHGPNSYAWTPERAFIWTAETGKQNLEPLNGYIISHVRSVSPDGNFALCSSNLGNFICSNLIWNRKEKTVHRFSHFSPSGITNKGTVVGSIFPDREKIHPITCGLQGLPAIYIPGDGIKSFPPSNGLGGDLFDATSHSSIYAGHINEIAALWTPTKQWTSLGCLEGDNTSWVNMICDNGIVFGGSRLVSRAEDNSPYYHESREFIWSENTGMIPTSDLIGTYTSLSISKDGTFIVMEVDTPDRLRFLKLFYLPNFTAYMEHGITPPCISLS